MVFVNIRICFKTIRHEIHRSVASVHVKFDEKRFVDEECALLTCSGEGWCAPGWRQPGECGNFFRSETGELIQTNYFGSAF